MLIDRDDYALLRHIGNGNPLENRRSNLRLCIHAQNCRNRRNRKDHKSSRYKGVGKSKRGGYFYACITKKGKRYNLGSYVDERKAGLAYNLAASLLYGDFAYYNNVGFFEQEEVEEFYEEIKEHISARSYVFIKLSQTFLLNF